MANNGWASPEGALRRMAWEQRYVHPVLAFLSAWEFLSVTVGRGRIPSISGTVIWLRRRWWGQALLWLLHGWACIHWYAIYVVEESAITEAS